MDWLRGERGRAVSRGHANAGRREEPGWKPHSAQEAGVLERPRSLRNTVSTQIGPTQKTTEPRPWLQ